MPGKLHANPLEILPPTDDEESHTEPDDIVDPSRVVGEELSSPNKFPINVMEVEPDETVSECPSER